MMPHLAHALLGAALCGILAACAAPIRPAGSVHAIDVAGIRHPDGETPAWWFRAGAAAAAANRAGLGTAQSKAKNVSASPQARNVIVFLGDGMSAATIAAARILEGQRKGQSGEENRLSFETFPYTALLRTYTTDFQTPDSAGTMTAIMTGIKTRSGVIGVNQIGRRGDCKGAQGNEAVTALELAARTGMATGAVTTTRITHATPAATYGHLPERDWEYDMAMPDEARAQGCVDFARQLVEFPFGGGLDVALGGGRTEFMPAPQPDPQYDGLIGKRLDKRDLIREWQARPGAAYVWNAEQLANVDPAKTKHLLGLFNPEHMQYEYERTLERPVKEPSLAEMTRAAIAVLKHNPNGFFLMVEGGRIDHGHHAGNAYRALTETIAFSDAIRAAVELVNADDTLILVTADHSHTMTFAGYANRGNPILGKLRGSSGEGAPSKELARDAIGRSFTTLGYANGPGYAGESDHEAEGAKKYPHNATAFFAASRGRPDLDEIDTEAPDYMQESVVPLGSETHSGDDVAVFARGPGAAAVHGSLEQNVLFHLIAQANEPIRRQLCAFGSCNADGVPVDEPAYKKLHEASAVPR